MAYNEILADRISRILINEQVPFEEKKMFGGIAFMIQDKMCIGIVKEDLMLRVLDERYEETLNLHGAREMDFTGRSLKGFIYVDAAALNNDANLLKWVEMGIQFGKHGKLKSKSKK